MGHKANRAPIDHPINLSDITSDVLTVEEAAAVLRIPLSTAYEYIRTKQIPSRKIGSHVRVPKPALAKMLGLAE